MMHLRSLSVSAPSLALCLLLGLFPSRGFAQTPDTAPPASIAEDRNVLIRVQIFGVPPASAAIISKNAALQSDDTVFLRQMEKWVAEKKVQLRATPAVLARSGQRCVVEGGTRVEVEAIRQGPEKANLNLAIAHGSGTESGTGHLQKEVNVSLGATIYLGSMEVPANPATKSPAATCFVFLSAQ